VQIDIVCIQWSLFFGVFIKIKGGNSMKRGLAMILCIAVFLVSCYSLVSACTTMLIGKNATIDGSIIVAHSDDDELGDQRIVYVPAKDHKPGSKRPVYPYNVSYPRYVGKDRGLAYDISSYPATKPLGYIDQVSHTYAYFDGNYAIMNEAGLIIGECTDAANLNLDPKQGERMVDISELSRIAAERCDTPVDAIKLMGDLAVKYGYYGWGETLLVADDNEGWVFEICGSPDKKSALWVAKRVPDDKVFAAANEFRIREINPDDPDIMYSPNLFEACEKAGWWNPDEGSFDWLKAVSPGEYNHPYYSLRRVWRIFDRLNPDLRLSPWVEDGYTKAYPFSIVPKNKVSVRDVMALYRDHYEGTEFDMTKGLAAGPFGSPNRWIGPDDGSQNTSAPIDENIKGAWERPISIFYGGYSFICQRKGWLPPEVGTTVWLGLDSPYTTCYVPFYAGVKDLPKSYQTGNTSTFSRDTAWWAFNFVANWAELKYDYMKKDIQTKQKEIEDREFAEQADVEKKAMELYRTSPMLVSDYLTDYCNSNALRVVSEWWDMADMLVSKYDDGYVNDPKVAEEVGYPEWWRKDVGYQNGPKSYEKPKQE